MCSALIWIWANTRLIILGYLTETFSNAMLGYHGPSCYAVRLDKKREKNINWQARCFFFIDVPFGRQILVGTFIWDGVASRMIEMALRRNCIICLQRVVLLFPLSGKRDGHDYTTSAGE